jgi:hypothetical protein
MKTKITLFLSLCLLVITVNAQSDELKIPAEVQPFVETNSKAIALKSADLNGDGTKDYILVLEREISEDEKADYPENQRPLIILIRSKDNKLSEVKRNESIVLCSQCGGIFGDPFSGVEVGDKTFTVNHYGGSAWRWSNSYKFNYSRIDNTWQLVRVEKSSYHNVRPMKETLKETVLTPPKDFGKVDIADFDADDYDEYNTKNLIEFKNGAYTAQMKGKFTKADEEMEFNVKAEKGQRMIVNILPLSEGLATAGTVSSPNGENDGQPGGLVMNSVLKESGYYKIRVTQRPTDHKLPAEFMVEVSLLPSFVNDEIVKEKPAANYEKLDVKSFNEKIQTAAAAKESWVKYPTRVVANLVEEFSETKSRNIEIVSKFADVTDDLTVIVTDDGYADDSVRGVQYKFQMKRNEQQGIWQIVSAEKAQRCWQGRGHQDYSSAPCL